MAIISDISDIMDKDYPCQRSSETPLWYNLHTRKSFGTLGEFAKVLAVSRYNCLKKTSSSKIKRNYFRIRHFVARHTPKSLHYCKREKTLRLICELDK